ncbi:MAG: MFS transporter [Alphaproteobacteria bacterium]|nr:MFS transporter [Alphaproteobacteria bacterium]TAD91228.1 MAG: MFS transporter [Alphaproteobacteria bacterium]
MSASLLILFLAAALAVLGNALLMTLTSVHLSLAGVALEVTGPVTACYYLGLILGSLRGPPVIARVGHIRSFVGFGVLVVVASLLMPLVTPGWWWVPLRLAAGFGMAGLFVVIESWLQDRVDPAYRGRVLGLYMVVNFGAIAAGQQLLALGVPGDFQLYSIAAILVALALPVLAVQRVEAPAIRPMVRLKLVALYRTSPLGLVGVALVGAANGAFTSLMPIVGKVLGLPLSEVALLLTLAVLGGLAGQIPVGKLSDRFDRRRVLAFDAGLLVLLAMAMAGGALLMPSLMVPLAFAYGIAAFTLYPLCVAHAQDFAGPDQRIGTASGLLLAFGAGATLGPILVVPAMTVLGPVGLFAFTGGVAGLLALYTLYRMGKRAAPPAARFVATPTTTPTVTQLDPLVPPPEPDAPPTAGSSPGPDRNG